MWNWIDHPFHLMSLDDILDDDEDDDDNDDEGDGNNDDIDIH